jgi:hypothetical protein
MRLRIPFVAMFLVVLSMCMAVASLHADVSYNANTDMIVKETGGSPNATFGPWQIGWADDLTLPAAAAVNSTTLFGTAGLSGWGKAADVTSPYVVVNTSGSTYSALGGALNVDAGEMVFHNGPLTGSNYTLLNWTAWKDGLINIDTLCKQDHAGTAINCFIGKNIGKGGAWFSSTLNEISPAHPTFESHITNVSVVAGDTIMLDFGYSSGYENNYVGVFHGVTYVPEPCSMMLMATGAIGLLAYAWRKRR